MNSNEVSDAYLLGLREGRDLLRSNPDMTREDMQRGIEALGALLRQRPSLTMRDVYKGERDFWRHQLERTS